MKVILINGSPHKNGCTYTALKEVADTLEKRHIETDILYLGQKPIAGCIACGKCDEEGICTFDDHVNIIIQKMNQYLLRRAYRSDLFFYGKVMLRRRQETGRHDRGFYSHLQKGRGDCGFRPA